MKRHLNTLYVTTQGAYLAKDGETVLVRVDGEPKLRIPAHNLEGIVCFGNVGFSPFLLGHCGSRGVGVSFLSENGRFLARVHGQTTGNVLLRREQYHRSDDAAASATIARNVLLGKLANSRSILLRAMRDHPGAEGRQEVQRAAEALAQGLREAERGPGLETLRGIEGAAAREYFSVFQYLVVQQKADFPFASRSRRPPLDRVNALLSFLYTLLVHDLTSALEAVGLDPAVGFLHRDRPGRPSLALDLMEELRPFLADRLALSLINLRRIGLRDFDSRETGAVLLNDAGRKKVLVAYQNRKNEGITHPFLKEKTSIGMLVHLQALLLARHLRGDLDAYPPFLAK